MHQKTVHNLQQNRGGNILVLAAGAIIFIMGFTAFVVDIGYISLTRAQLQNAADAASMAAAYELGAALDPGQPQSLSQTESTSRAAAVNVAALNNAGGSSSPVYLSAGGDVQFGRRTWSDTSQSWQYTWGASPYNVVQVSAHRDRVPEEGSTSSTNDQPLNLFFAPVMGQKTAGVSVSSTAALSGAGGFRINASSSLTAGVLPITYDLPSWNEMLAGAGEDNFRYDYATRTVSAGSDGVREIDLYPYGNQSLTPGNRGTVDLGSPNNSTADLVRQIKYGLNATDLSYFGGTLRTDNGPLYLNGDTGISAGIKSALETIKGKPRAIPIFTEVSGPGNNAMYTVVKFVGIRIMEVQLTGGSKRVVAQPAQVIDPTAFSTTNSSASEFIYTKPQLVH